MNAFDFQFNLAVSGWRDLSSYTFQGPTVDQMDHYLYLALDRDLENPSLDAYAGSRIDLITGSLRNIETLQNGALYVGQMPAKELVLRWMPEERLVRYKRYLFVVKDSLGFTFNCDFTKKSFALLSDQMTQIVANLINPYWD